MFGEDSRTFLFLTEEFFQEPLLFRRCIYRRANRTLIFADFSLLSIDSLAIS